MKRACLVAATGLLLTGTPLHASANELSADLTEYRACLHRAVKTTQLTCGKTATLVSSRDACFYSLAHIQGELAGSQKSLTVADRAVSRLVQVEEAKAKALLARAYAERCRDKTPQTERRD